LLVKEIVLRVDDDRNQEGKLDDEVNYLWQNLVLEVVEIKFTFYLFVLLWSWLLVSEDSIVLRVLLDVHGLSTILTAESGSVSSVGIHATRKFQSATCR
jgi:hypothetical protein